MPSPAARVRSVPFHDGATIPQLGFGVFQVPPEQTFDAVTLALEAGYRHIDTAAAYANEAQVGAAVRSSGLERHDVYVTTKCFNDDHGFEEARRACRLSLERLGLGPIDLYLVHWPVPSHDRYVETWRALIELRERGDVRSIGVSNFQPAHLERIVDATGVVPVINQVELHPYLQQPELRREHDALGIVTEAWSPLAQGAVLRDPAIVAIATRHDRTPGQVVLRWHLQLGDVVIPKSATPSRIRENLDVLDFELDEDDMAAIAGLDRGERTGPDPDTFVHPGAS